MPMKSSPASWRGTGNNQRHQNEEAMILPKKLFGTVKLAALARAALTAAIVLVLLFGGKAAVAGEQQVRQMAQLIGLYEVDEFVETVMSIRATGYLPEWYITKRTARDWGWRPGRDLCDVTYNHTIGGDRFGNREGRLPDRRSRQWYEADLDFDCGRRGARRLVFSNDGLIYVTLDHYETFIEVPR